MHDALQQRGGSVVAVAVDPPAQSARLVAELGLPFAVLADTELEVARRYGLVHRGAGPGGADIAIPALFLVDRGGAVVWRHIAGRIPDRADPAEVVAEVTARWP